MKKLFAILLLGLFLFMPLAGSATATEAWYEVQQSITYTEADFVELQRGDKSDEVMKLQSRLIALGYLTDTADGSFGKKTAAAVADFQTMNGLYPTGTASPADQVVLYSIYAVCADGTMATTGIANAQASMEARATAPPQDTGTSYIANTNTYKFHYPDCSSVKQMKDKNKMAFTGSRDDLIARGYAPCKRCNP